MSRKGNCWDNAVAESFFSSLLTAPHLKASAYVFGNEVGEQVKSVKTAWRAA